ncbi:MAG: hypothetical protein PHU44_14180 [Syntrophales bacterium]|nr:hypothetical protein [Syntrophales bacterium]MDD5640071.1 hypothetical protein [Syntrophales bacterium]
MSEGEEDTREMEMVERVRPLVNEILERFNQEDVTPSEAGMVILALISRLLEALEGHPEPRRQFILNLIEMVNSYLLKEAGEAPQSCPAGSGGPE